MMRGGFLVTMTIVLMMLAVLLSMIVVVRAHEWYPTECCWDKDCAPVEQVTLRPEGLLVISRHGMAVVPQSMERRFSKDGRMHVCMVPDGNGGMKVRCFFEGPGV